MAPQEAVKVYQVDPRIRVKKAEDPSQCANQVDQLVVACQKCALEVLIIGGNTRFEGM